MGIFQDTVDAINSINVQYGAMPKWWPKFIKNIIYRNNRKKIYKLVTRFRELSALETSSLSEIFHNILDHNPPLGNFGICKNVKLAQNDIIAGIVEFKIAETDGDYTIVSDVVCSPTYKVIRYVLVNGNGRELRFNVEPKEYITYDNDVIRRIPMIPADEFLEDGKYIESYTNKQLILLAWNYLDNLYRQTGRIIEI